MAISEGDRQDAYLSRSQAPVLDMDGIAEMLRRRAVFIAAVTFSCLGICLAWMLLSPPKYIASGRVLLDLPESAAEASDANAVAIENQILVMTSRGVYDRVIAQEKLTSDPLFGGRPRSILSTLLSGIGLGRTPDPHALALRQLGRSVSVVRNPGSSAVDVNVVSPDRETAARIANAVMEGYVAEQAALYSGAPSGTAESSDPRLHTLQSRLRNAEQRYEAFRAQNLKPESNGQSSGDKQVNDLSGQLSTAEAKVGSLRSTLGQLQRARKVLDSGGIPDRSGGAFGPVGQRYAAVKQLELDLSETLGPRHPDLVIARLRAADAKRPLDQLIRDRTQSTAAELEQARSSVTQLKSRLESSKQDLIVSNEATARLKELANDVEASRVAYQAVLARFRDAGGGPQQSGHSNARIISRATVPLEPSGPFPAGILLTSLLLGLGLGVSLAWLLELMDPQKEPVSVP